MLSRFVVSQVKHNSYFLVGVALGLWLALVAVPLEEEAAACVAGVAGAAPSPDEFEPHREARPLGAAGPAAGRSVQRPRYYTTELGMRGSLMSGVLSSEAGLASRAAALNATAARLQLRVFVAAAGASPPRAGVVGFTDAREMLKPFHALKYLADNYLDEYDFFFLVSDASFVNAWRLRELVGRLSVSQDVYMGTVAEDDSHYCTLDGGVLLSSSVLRAVHGELDWCVRNSYSAHHHENLGRCVLHAAHLRCTSALQGETYTSVRLAGGPLPLTAGVAQAVTVHPVTERADFHRLHAFTARVRLRRGAAAAARLRAQLARTGAQHPPGYRNTSWPAGLRDDPGLAPPSPSNRFDHVRWTLFNASHAFLADDLRAAAPLPAAHKAAVQLVLTEATAWALRRWEGAEAARVQLVEGAWRWEPPHALRYRLLLRHTKPGGEPPTVRLVEVSRALGAARLVAAPYVTESARVWLLQPLTPPARAPALRAGNVARALVIMRPAGGNASAVAAARAQLAALARERAPLELAEADDEPAGGGGETAAAAWSRRQRAALRAVLPRLPRDALLLLLPPAADYNDDFLNRVRMNSIPGWQWFLALGFARYAAAARPAAHAPHAGRFHAAGTHALAFYRKDYEDALAAWRGSADASVAEILAASPLRCVRAPDPALVLPAPPPPCAAADPGRSPAPAPAPAPARSPAPAPAPAPARSPAPAPAPDPACLRAHRDAGFQHLLLGDRHGLARLLLEERAKAD